MLLQAPTEEQMPWGGPLPKGRAMPPLAGPEESRKHAIRDRLGARHDPNCKSYSMLNL